MLTLLSAFGQNKYAIQPKPIRLDAAEGQFVLAQHLIIAVAGTDPDIRRLAEGFAHQVGKVAGRDTKVFAGNFRVKDGINFVISKDPKLGAEGYFLEITPKRIVITAEQHGGFSRGLNSLMQLMPAEIFGNSRAEGVYWKIPCCYIEDRPNH
jgi:hexosaminidase